MRRVKWWNIASLVIVVWFWTWIPAFWAARWYPQQALPAPDREQPWYRLLVDGREYQTYAPESALSFDAQDMPVEHLSLRVFFKGFQSGRYQPRWIPN